MAAKTFASAAVEVAIFGGDCGFEFAPKELRPLAHIGDELDGLSVDKEFRIGMVLNGLSDNVYRASLSHGHGDFDISLDYEELSMEIPDVGGYGIYESLVVPGMVSRTSLGTRRRPPADFLNEQSVNLFAKTLYSAPWPT